ncbi:hypothetical protein ASPVEDRAFT_894994 [Aspergillus versicolor CBS 583.65]|uniref:Zn(2)-C6 fungal-type domain-containing protein n=1 Tax=Aspergillus versicolor CBS 583.65 TaxID=1036611 RepID=A0A1L9PW86_ASPVE|nr:uncharacterized protein ASPVEDRAFT_894994 [Aspergillus versicolor CBS 583.65]OJJ05791.1 hypothetical protein ASPVEDRAFT_894994 [Aspergillus versicolor CBS 583.65]
MDTDRWNLNATSTTQIARMFFTLKHNRHTAESSFEKTAAPFTKKREGRLAKVACTNCRMSKLKCSGELRGCQRCRGKKIECQYPRMAKEKDSPSPSPPTPEAVQQLEQAKGRSPSPLAPAQTEPNIQEDFIDPAALNQKPAFSANFQDLGLAIELDASDFTMSENTAAACTLLSEEEYMELSNTMVQCQQPFTSVVNTSNTPWDDMLQMENTDFNTSNYTTPPTLSPPEPTESTCSCFFQAVGTHEAIEVAVWCQKESFSDVQDILRHHKQVLAECEGLLECSRCSKNPGFIMLLISMVRKILESLGRICQVAGSPRSTSERAPATNAEFNRESRVWEKVGNGNVNQGRNGYGISIQGQQLDDDDEYLVLQSLLKARVAKLEHLLGLLHKVVVEQSWPAHKSLVRCLQSRVLGRWIIE